MLTRRLIAEALGSLLLTGAVIGSGILGGDMAAGNEAVALIGNTAATAAILFVLITVLGPISGAHFNPAVSFIFALKGQLTWRGAALYACAQVLGCMLGAVLTHAMFELPLVQTGLNDRAGAAKIFSEAVATFALVFTILGTIRMKPEAAPTTVALIITAGYWWTSSTSFANPAITIARALTDSFAGIRPQDAPGFIVGQFAGALLGLGAAQVLFNPKAEESEA